MGEQTFTTLELNCPGCGAFFRLKPKRGRLPKGPIPCPKCNTPIPVPKAQAQTSDEAPTSEEKPKEAEPPQAQIMGRGILKKKKKLPTATKPPELVPTPVQGHPMDLLDRAFDEEVNKPSATFLGFPTLDNSGIGGLKKPSPTGPLSTQELESGQAPENSNAPWTNPFHDKSEEKDDFAREPTIVDDQAIIDKLREVRNTQDVDPITSDQPLRDTKDLSPLDPSKPLRDTKEFDPVDQVDRQTPISMDKLDKLFDDEQSNQQAKVKPQDVSWKEDPAGPFDLRDILEAEKNLGNDISGEITRNPALDESIYPTGEHKPAKPLPDDSFSTKMDKPKSSQLSKLSLSGSSALSIHETSDRSNSGAFQQARVSTGDIFSESSAVMGDDALNFTSPNDESQLPVPQTATPSAGDSSFGNKPDKLPEPTTAEVMDPVDQLIQKEALKPIPETPSNLVQSPKLDFNFDSESEAITTPEEPKDIKASEAPPEVSKETPKEDAKPTAKTALASLLKKKVGKEKLSKLKSSLTDASEAASANSTPKLGPPKHKLDLDLNINEISSALGLNEASEEQSASRATDEFDAQSLASISEAVFDKPHQLQGPFEDKPQDNSQETIELNDVDELVAQTESTDPVLKVPNLPESTVPAKKTISGQHLALKHLEDEDATMEVPIDTLVKDDNVRGTVTGQHLAISDVEADTEEEKPASALPEPVTPFNRLDLKSALQRKLQARTQEKNDEFESSKSTLFGTPTSDAHEDPKHVADAQDALKPAPIATPVDASINASLKEEISDALDISGLKLEAPSEIEAFPETPASAAVLESPTEQGQKDDPRAQSGIPLISGFPTPSSKSTDDLKIIRSKRRKPGDSHSGLFAQSIAKSLSNESPVTLGAAGERRGSGYIRLPTAEILEVLGEGSYRLMVEDIVYEPVDEQGLTALIKQGVLLGAEQIAEADGDWMPIAEHPVFRRLRRKMAIEAHALLAKYKRKQHEEQPEEDHPSKIVEERFSTTRPLHAVTAPEDKDPYNPSEGHDDETKQKPLPDLPAKRVQETPEEEIIALSEALADNLIDESEVQDVVIPPTPLEATETFEEDHIVEEQPAIPEPPQMAIPPTPEQFAQPVGDVEQTDPANEAEPVVATQPSEPQPVIQEANTEVHTAQEKPSAQPAPTPELPMDNDPLVDKPSGSSIKWLLALLLLAAVAMAVVVAVKPEWLGLNSKTTPQPKTLATKNNAKNSATPKTTPKTDSKVTSKDSNNAQNKTKNNNDQNDANPSELKKSPLTLAMDKDKAGDHAGAVALLKPLYEKNPNDIEQTLLYARTLNKAKQYKLARTVSIKALATKQAKKDDEARLKSIYKQSIINDATLTQTKATELKQGDMDGIEYIGEEKKYLYVKIRQGGQAKYIFKPAQVEWDNRWRADVAAWRLCEMLMCHFKVPKTVPAKIEKATFIKMMKGLDTAAQKKGLDRVLNGDELNVVKEDNGSGQKVQYIYGALQTYHDDDAPFPFEYKALWAAMINVTEEEKELKRDVSDVLSLFKRVGGGKFHEAVTREVEQANTTELISQVSSLLVFDYLINHRDRFARRSKQYGESTFLRNGHLVTRHHGMSWPPDRASSTIRRRFRYASRFSRTLVMSLELIDPKFANDVLFPDASKTEKRQLKILWKQRKNALKGIENLKKKYTEESVLFFP